MPNSILAIETSSAVMSVALQKGKEEILEKTVHGFSNHAENLLPSADDLLKKRKVAFKDVKTILIGRGPGSFTGLRVGFATLKGLLKKQKCYGILSLDLISENALIPEGSVLCVCLDARREKIYSRLYKKQRGQWKALSKAQVLSFEEWIETLPQGANLCGDALAKYRAKLEAIAGKNFTLLPEHTWYPRASTLISLFLKKSEKFDLLEKPKDFLPLYFRLSEAEERRKEKLNAYTC